MEPAVLAALTQCAARGGPHLAGSGARVVVVGVLHTDLCSILGGMTLRHMLRPPSQMPPQRYAAALGCAH